MFERAMSRSRELFDSGWYCAESVLQAVAEELGSTCEAIPKMATGFCSGLARSDGVCGALNGAVLGVGLILGREKADQSVDSCYRAVRAVIDGFVNRFGADTCQKLTGCHLGTEEGQARFHALGIHKRCQEVVSEATRWALKAIADEQAEGPNTPG